MSTFLNHQVPYFFFTFVCVSICIVVWCQCVSVLVFMCVCEYESCTQNIKKSLLFFRKVLHWPSSPASLSNDPNETWLYCIRERNEDLFYLAGVPFSTFPLFFLMDLDKRYYIFKKFLLKKKLVVVIFYSMAKANTFTFFFLFKLHVLISWRKVWIVMSDDIVRTCQIIRHDGGV